MYALTQSGVSAAGELIDFSGAILNMDNTFDLATDTYTCQETGTYAFYASMMSSETQYATVDILLDGVLVITVIANDSPEMQTAAMAVLNCSMGSEVSLVWKFSTSYQIIGSEFSRTSTFSGFLIGLSLLNINVRVHVCAICVYVSTCISCITFQPTTQSQASQLIK